MPLKNLLLIVCATMIAACGEPKIDGSSEEAFTASVAKVAESMPPEKREQFQKAVKVVAFSQINMGDMLSGKANAETVKSDMYTSLSGKSGDEVIARANVILEERAAKEKEQALQEIQELVNKKAAADSARAELAKFAVLRSRFMLQDQPYLSHKKPVISLSVTNGTGHAVSRAYFKGTIASPGRSIPWFTGAFNYEIPGGLEPGESADWNLEPNMFSEWGKVNAPADALFTLEVVRLDGADKAALYDAQGLSEREQERLDKLKMQYQ
ncbi:DUF6694 family lipoprotein [Aquipseudomonas alcaligenes]|uniref:Lipoprotein n=1 Tax=Aquipseudomonas alcaligenes TaxID=43263 RepID=A0A1N6S807_AQUAC|nr:DUF6694 family lipoprotein [Pseudomonas alcaligenes]SIQ37086.1 hypothetical protein SAMN05878282_103411 [Pseudomonas alcaligenes]